MEKILNDFNTFVSELVIYHMKMDKFVSIDYLAEKTGLSVSFIQKALYKPSEKHFNSRHIFLLANAMYIDSSELMPSKNNYRKITNKEIDKIEWEKFINRVRGGKE